jgi:hypothetical protein
MSRIKTILYTPVGPSLSTYWEQLDLYLPMIAMFFFAKSSLQYAAKNDMLFNNGRLFTALISPYIVYTIGLLLFEYITNQTLKPRKLYNYIDAAIKIVWLAFTGLVTYGVSGFGGDGFIYTTIQDGWQRVHTVDYDFSFYKHFINISILVFVVLIIHGWKKQRRLFTI